jgi:hypothetical protein
MIRTKEISIDESTGSLIAKNLDHKSLINRPWEDRSKQNFRKFFHVLCTFETFHAFLNLLLLVSFRVFVIETNFSLYSIPSFIFQENQWRKWYLEMYDDSY